MIRKITGRLIESLMPKKGAPLPGRIRVTDDELRGFGVTIYPNGEASYFVEYDQHGRRRRMVFARYPELTADQARAEATKYRAQVLTKEVDPLEQKRLQKVRSTTPNFAQWVRKGSDTESEGEYHKLIKARKRSFKQDETYLALAIKAWGKMRLDEIKTQDVQRLFDHTKARGRIMGNRALAAWRSCLSEAWRQNLVPENVALRVKPLPENPARTRVLTDDELSRLFKAIAAETDLNVRAAFLLRIYTGVRESEVLRAKWEDFNLAESMWIIPRAKSGRREVIPLPLEMVELLKRTPKKGPFLLPGRDPAEPRNDLKGPWDRIREAAKLTDVWAQDLRRSFGVITYKKHGLRVAQQLLRHSDIRVTARVYTPLEFEDLKKATESVSLDRGKLLNFKRKRTRVKRQAS